MKDKVSLALLAAASLLIVCPRTAFADKTDNRYRHAVATFQRGDLDGATQELEDILRSKPDYENARMLLGLIDFRRSQDAERDGEQAGAIAELRQALLQDPDEPYWERALAQLLEKQGDVEGAVKECHEAARLSPDDSGLASGCGLKTSEHSEKEPPEKKPDASQENGGGEPATVTKVGGEVSPPRPVNKPEPPYSERARAAKVQGTVTLWIVVGADGSVERAEVETAAGLGLDEQALRTVRTWTFQPATRAGVPVPVRVRVEVSFRLF